MSVTLYILSKTGAKCERVEPAYNTTTSMTSTTLSEVDVGGQQISAVERTRLAAVRRLNILDTEPEQVYDDIVMLAARMCSAPVAFISFFDNERQWFKAQIGMNETSFERNRSIGEYTLVTDGPLIVPDTAADERFNSDEITSRSRSYLGFPLHDLDHVAVGVLGVVHRVPTDFTSDQVEMLAALARQVQQLFVLRATVAARSLDRDHAIERETRFRSVLQSLAHGVIVHGADGVITDCNPAAEALIGVERKELLGMGPLDRRFEAEHEDGTPFQDDDRPIAITLRYGIEVRDVVVGIRGISDGVRRWLLVNTSPLWGPNGRSIGAVVTMADVTEMLTLTNQLQESLADLARAAQERSALLSAVSHDIRAPLAAIRMMTEILEDRADAITDSQRNELVSRVRAEARRTEGVLADLVTANRVGSGLEAPRRKRIDVEQLLYSRVREFDGATHSIKVDRVQGDLTLWADAAQVERILDNLISNAITHTPVGSKVLVSVEERGPNLEIAVDDNGPGVPDEMRVSVFAAYVRGKNASDRPGSGLGLFLVQQFAQFHGGSARCMRSDRGGARFVVMLPRRPGNDSVGVGQ
jgi:PAS domain S-box-containing protein